MKHERKKLFKRALALVLAATMCFSMLQIGAAAKTISTLTCGQEAHMHNSTCYENVKGELICTQTSTPGHKHELGKCYTENTIHVYKCGIEEGSQGVKQTENPTHTHTDSCYTYTTTLTCTLAESAGHTHDVACYDEEGNLVCPTPEGEGHAHSENCYTSSRSAEPACGLTEGAALNPKLDVHTHSDETCPYYEAVTEKVFTCTETEAEPVVHEHTDACYNWTQQLTCEKPEHTHTPEACQEREQDEIRKEITDELEKKQDAADYDDTILLIMGGVVLNVPGQFVISNGHTVIIVDNGTLNGTGNRIFAVKNGQLVIDGDVEMTNGKGGSGGAIYIGQNGDVTMNKGSITGNKTSNPDGNGGAVHVDGGKFTMNGGEISGNEANFPYQEKPANNNGGGVAVDNNGTFVMNNGTISNNSAAINGGGVAVNNGTFVMNGGTISNNSAAVNGGGVAVNDGTFVMNGGTISENHSTDSGNETDKYGNITVDKDGNLVVSGVGGGIYVDNNGSLVMNGGTVSSNEAAKGGGVGVNNGKFTMNGGTIDENKAVYDKTSTETPKWNADGQGGGVYVIGKDGTLTFLGGTISNNTAYEGGGIFIASKDDTTHQGNLVMNGGVVDGNIAEVGEGGGIYIRGNATISAGQISNNETYSQSDLGGGGIYIEHNGTLNLTDALIKENAAAGLGAGLAACVNGKTFVFAQNGAAIYDNKATADKDGNVTGNAGYINKENDGSGSYIDGSSTWKDNAGFQNGTTDENGKTTGGSKDVLIASANKKPTADGGGGNPGAVLSNEMLGGGLANWSGTSYQTTTQTEDGKDWQHSDPEKIDGSNNGVIVAGGLLGLQSDPVEVAKKAAEAMAKVLIFGNKSFFTHGAGIANNGTLIIGTNPGDDTIKGIDSNTVPTIDLEKTLTGRPLKDGEFNFELYDAEGKTIEGYTVTNDANGKAQIRLPEQYFTAKDEKGNYYDGDYVFYFREKPGNDSTVDYDDSFYRVVITVQTETDTETAKNIAIGDPENGGATHYTISKRKIPYKPIKEKQIIDSMGNVIWSGVNNIHFVNHAHPTEPPRETPPPTRETPPPTTPPVTPTPSDEPTPPPDDEPIEDDPVPLGTPTPEPPDEPIDDDPVPMGTPTPEPEEPDEELPDPEIPKGPSEPEEELPDPDVPLADVPKTGDETAIWYVLTFVCASGLAVLALSGRRKKTVK